MVDTLYPADAVSGSPLYSGRKARQTLIGTTFMGAKSGRPLGIWSGVRPGTPLTTVTATSTTWTVHPHAGAVDLETAAEAGGYTYAIDADKTGAMTAAHATLTRWDGIYVCIDDPAEGDGTTTPATRIVYAAGSTTPAMPTAPARSMLLAKIIVPSAASAGSPSVVWSAPYQGVHIMPVRSQAERDLITWGNSEVPAFVTRADQGGAIECNSGSGWKEVARPTPYAATFALNALWSAHSRGVSLTRIGGRWLLDVAITNVGAGSYTAGWAPLGTIPAEARTSGGTMAGGMCTLAGDSGFTASGMDLDLASGAVRFRVTSTATIAVGALEFHGQASWDA